MARAATGRRIRRGLAAAGLLAASAAGPARAGEAALPVAALGLRPAIVETYGMPPPPARVPEAAQALFAAP
ncbi:hypothetical protein, partial [Methylobacterium sp. CCH5-D2]